MRHVSQKEKDCILNAFNLIKAQEKSKLSILEFCNKMNISIRTFYKWQSKFRPGNVNSSKVWMKYGGILSCNVSRIDTSSIYLEWLKFADELQIEEESDSII